MRVNLFLLLVFLSSYLLIPRDIIANDFCYIDSIQYYKSYKKEYSMKKCNSFVYKSDSILIPLETKTYIFKTDTLENNWLYYNIKFKVS